MRLALSVDGDSGDDAVTSLHQWLLQERALRGRAQFATDGAEDPGDMGSAIELINVVLTNTIALSQLVLTLASWRASHPFQPPIRIEAGGVTVALDSDDPEFIRRVTEALRPESTGDVS